MSSLGYNQNNTIYTPPSSPPSPSSSAYVNSSSPPSSPGLDPLNLDGDYDVEDISRRIRTSSRLSEAPMDPLAGSYHGNRSHKRSSHAFLNSPPQTPHKKARYTDNMSPYGAEQSPAFDAETYRDTLLWEDAIETVFENGERKIDLTGRNIMNIPPHVIRDLGNIVVLPESGEPFDRVQAHLFSSTSAALSSAKRLFTRTHTAPATMPVGWGRFGSQGKTASSNSVLGVSREAMDLLLGQNNIARLPVELWRLHNLTVLSLRNNNITYLPPQIAQLKELQSLNVAHNKLRFIPAELLTLKKLTMLYLFPNPFIPEPTPNGKTKTVSEIVSTDPCVPSLTELALRMLLTPPVDVPLPLLSGTFKTKLEQMYELPLPTGQDWRPLSGSLRSILSVCVPGSIVCDDKAKVADDESNEITGIGLCPNPAHGLIPTVFVQHAEERYTWETSTPTIETLGGSAAVLWRGCLRGCLEFLEPEGKEKTIAEESMEVDDEEVVQTVLFAIAPLAFDD